MNSIFSYEHPFVCTDAVVFALQTREADSYRKLPGIALRVLLYRRDAEPFKGRLCLPGGFLNPNELPEDNIRRKLSAKADVSKCWLEQLFTFCGVDRDPRARVVSIAYLGLMAEAEAGKLGGSAEWFDVKAVPKTGLGFDHYQIIQTALDRLQSKIQYTDIVFNLLPETFTLTRLQHTYEAILGKRETAANFRRKVAGMVRETGLYTGDKGHRPAMLYTKR